MTGREIVGMAAGLSLYVLVQGAWAGAFAFAWAVLHVVNAHLPNLASTRATPVHEDRYCAHSTSGPTRRNAGTNGRPATGENHSWRE